MRLALALTCIVLTACDRPADAEPVAGGSPAPAVSSLASALDAGARPSFRRCHGSPGPASTGRGFDHKRSTLVAMGSPKHFAQDFFAAPGQSVEIAAKISYGDASKDLEDEAVDVKLDDCRALAVHGTAKTDSDGVARLQITAPAEPGTYDLQFHVEGDGTSCASTLYVLPPQTEIVVFDIDGTLTTDDAEVTRDVLDEHFGHIADGKYEAAAYAHGAELIQAWVDLGFVPVYLTGRPYWLVEHTRAWLARGKYPAGLVRTTLRQRDVLPRVDGVGAFKSAYLRSLVDAGYRIAAAHGNASTDVYAYAQAGVAPERTFIIGPKAGEGGTVAVHDDWSAVLTIARGHARAQQPFAWSAGE